MASPAPRDLPPARIRARRGGPTLTTIDALIEVVTPIFGGGVRPRELDDVDVIRPASVRGHLRFWWRALNGHRHEAAELHDQEGALWGRVGTEHEGRRSAVELRVEVQRAAQSDPRPVNALSPEELYALWPAREEQRSQTPTAERRAPGTRFRLTLVVPKDREAEVREVVRAWILFGGYGGRTRRGLGSLRVLDQDREWLPAEATHIADCFGRDIFSPPPRAVGDTPWLAGASLHVCGASGNAQQAWVTSLSWLREFRQGTASGARQRGSVDRPSISSWPEADKIRRHSRPQQTNRWAHLPRHNAIPVWPRAAFGLPIIGQFQKLSREPRHAGSGPRHLRWDELPTDHRNYGEEPAPFELGWHMKDEHGLERTMDRLASPLIVKPLPLAGGRFAPCALWLHRAYPNGKVGLVRRHGNDRALVKSTEAQFDVLVAPGDAPCFAPLRGKPSLRQAFLDWLKASYQTRSVP